MNKINSALAEVTLMSHNGGNTSADDTEAEMITVADVVVVAVIVAADTMTM